LFTIRHYLTETGEDPFQQWIKQLANPITKSQILQRIGRIEAGNFGDHKPCRDGVWEFRIHQGPGYRVYYALAGSVVVLLLCAGEKRFQDRDIKRAVDYWRDWQRR